jgi:hypothetical protein
MLTLRHALRGRPRLILWIMLAFAIQVLRPAVHPIAHRHPGDDRPHVHVGDAVFAIGQGAADLPRVANAGVAAPTLPVRPGDTRTGLRAVHDPGLHVHLPLPAHTVRLAPPATVSPHVVLTRWSAQAPSVQPAASRRPGQARSPPSAFA